MAIVVISAVSGQAQQSAWMQGYMAGRLSAGSEGGTAIMPYMMPGGMFAPSFGFGHGFGLFIGLGFVALAFVILTRGGRRGGHWQRRREWAERMHQRMEEEARRWHDEGGANPEERAV